MHTLLICIYFILILIPSTRTQPENNIELVFVTFKDNLLIENHRCNLESSRHTCIIHSSCFALLAEQKIFVSSANTINFINFDTLHT